VQGGFFLGKSRFAASTPSIPLGTLFAENDSKDG
jgi:hypothetical protein